MYSEVRDSVSQRTADYPHPRNCGQNDLLLRVKGLKSPKEFFYRKSVLDSEETDPSSIMSQDLSKQWVKEGQLSSMCFLL